MSPPLQTHPDTIVISELYFGALATQANVSFIQFKRILQGLRRIRKQYNWSVKIKCTKAKHEKP